MVLRDFIESVWAEPRVVPASVWSGWDLAIVAILVPATFVEGVLRTDVPWPAYTVAWTLVAVLALLGRKKWPLAATMLAFSAQSVAGLGPVVAGRDYGVLFVTACVLLFPYSLARWAAGRDVVIGLIFVLGCHFIREPLYGESAANIVLGVGFLLFPGALGVAMRFWRHDQQRKHDQIRTFEREKLARELHDTVAHHISGILWQARAGRAITGSDPARALGVLVHIEKAAAKSIAEMRSLVGILRQGEEGARTPAQGVGDLDELIRSYAGKGHVVLRVCGELDGVDSTVDAVIYRVVQESLTNTRLHARNATRIDVKVTGSTDRVDITVADNGHAHARNHRHGYGLVGMGERMQLLGGILQAGPDTGGGWTVSATIPRSVGPR